MKTFDLSKCPKNEQGNLLCQTRDGLKVRIVCVDSKSACGGQWHPIVALIASAAFGEFVQLYDWNGNCKNPDMDDPSDLINLPEPKKLRPWRAEEVPMPCVLRTKNGKTRWQILSVSDYGVGSSDAVFSAGTTSIASFASLLENNEYSTDGGEPWHPCGVEE